MKNLTISICLILTSYTVAAQRNFHKLNFGVGAGITLAQTDYAETKIGFTQNALLDYYFTPYTSFGVEVQYGSLQGRQSPIQTFENKYLAVLGNGKVHFGEFLPFSYQQTTVERMLKGVYIGAGLGLIKNKVYEYKDTINIPTITRINANREFPANKEILVPLNAGIDIYVVDTHSGNRVAVNLNAQSAFALGDILDGNFTRSNDRNDRYNFFSVGLRFSFGHKGYYSKGWPR